MSKWLDFADDIATLFGTVDALDGIDIVVDRQKDLAAEVAKATGKAKGAAVVILWAGADNEDPACDGPRMRADYEISIYCKPVLRGDQSPADDIAEAVASALHHWQPDGVSVAAYERMTVSRVAMVPDPKYLVYQIDARITVQL
jgi:hypothetical protein